MNLRTYIEGVREGMESEEKGRTRSIVPDLLLPAATPEQRARVAEDEAAVEAAAASEEFFDGGDGGGRSRVGGESSPMIPAGRRSEYWYEDLQETTMANEERSRANERLLVKIDERLALALRLLIGTLTAFLASVAFYVAF